MTVIQYFIILTVLFHTIIAFENIDSTTETLDLEDKVNHDNNVSVSAMSVTDEMYCTTQDNETYITNAQIELMKKGLIKLAVIQIQRREFESTWDFLEKINLSDDLSIELLINYTINNISCNSFNLLLPFINSTSNISKKLSGYRVLFNHLVSNTNISGITTNWLNFHDFLNHDVNTNDLQILLNELEFKFNLLLDASDFVFLTETEFYQRSNYHMPCWIHSYSAEMIHYNIEYMIQRICSTPRSDIAKLFSIMYNKGLNFEDVLTFVTELERNNRFNYTLFVLPWIQDQLKSPAYDQKSCQIRNQIIEKFPANSSYVKLLSLNHEYYIQSVYNNEYLHEMQVDSYTSSTYRNEKETRIRTSSSQRSIWKISSGNSREFEMRIKNQANHGLNYRNCPIHEELYVTTSRHTQGLRFEAEDIFNGRFRIRIPSYGYLKAGRKHNLEITDDINDVEANKVEWILKSLPNQDIKVKNECNISEAPKPWEHPMNRKRG